MANAAASVSTGLRKRRYFSREFHAFFPQMWSFYITFMYIIKKMVSFCHQYKMLLIQCIRLTKYFMHSHRQEDGWMVIGLLSVACQFHLHLPLLPFHHLAWTQADGTQTTSQHSGSSYHLQLLHGVPFCLYVLWGMGQDITNTTLYYWLSIHLCKLKLVNFFKFTASSWLANYSLFCQPVDYSESPLAMRVTTTASYLICIDIS